MKEVICEREVVLTRVRHLANSLSSEYVLVEDGDWKNVYHVSYASYIFPSCHKSLARFDFTDDEIIVSDKSIYEFCRQYGYENGFDTLRKCWSGVADEK